MLKNLLIFLLFLQPKADPVTVADSLLTVAMDQLHAGNYAESIVIGQDALDALGDADQEMAADIYSAMCNAYARPAKRNELGTVQQVGLVANIGLEYFLAEHISIGAEVAIVPLAFIWQSQSWGVYEGYSSITKTVLNYNKLISNGSRALTYGTSNIGVNLSVNYYF